MLSWRMCEGVMRKKQSPSMNLIAEMLYRVCKSLQEVVYTKLCRIPSRDSPARDAQSQLPVKFGKV